MGKVEGVIYKIVDLRTDRIVYIGSTRRSGYLSRWYNHYYNSKPERIGPKSQKIARHICAEGPRNFDILELEEYSCPTGRDLVAREFEWIQKFKPDCNVSGKAI